MGKRPGSMTEPAFNARDSTLDITNSYQQKMANSPEKFGRTISRDTIQTTRGSTRSVTSSEDESLPSAGELKDSIRRFVGDSNSEPEIVVATKKSSEGLQALPNDTEQKSSTDSKQLPDKSYSRDYFSSNSYLHDPKDPKTKGTVYGTLYTQSKGETTKSGSSPKLSNQKGPHKDSNTRTPGNNSSRSEVIEDEIITEVKSASQSINQNSLPFEAQIKPVAAATIQSSSINENNTGSTKDKILSALRSIVFEAYFILGVVCGIIFLTVLIAETDEPPKIETEIPPEPTTEAEEAIAVTNNAASLIRKTSVFSMFYDGVYAPIRAFLVQYLSWMFQT